MSEFWLRKAELYDVDMIFRWANEDEVRKNSFQTEPIPYETHVKWYQDVLEKIDVFLYVVMKEGIPIGQVRFRIEKTIGEISYSISREFRGNGYGTIALKLLEMEVKKEFPQIEVLKGYVKTENQSSRKSFKYRNYNEQKVSESYLLYEKNIRI